MIRAYPHGVLLDFSSFPDRLRVVLGEAGASLVPGASFGTAFVLSQTPKSGVMQGVIAENATLPDRRVIYSDTGSDGTFSIKVSFGCYGSFFVAARDDAFLTFQVFRSIIIETPGNDPVEHGIIENHATTIPVTVDMSLL